MGLRLDVIIQWFTVIIVNGAARNCVGAGLARSNAGKEEHIADLASMGVSTNRFGGRIGVDRTFGLCGVPKCWSSAKRAMFSICRFNLLFLDGINLAYAFQNAAFSVEIFHIVLVVFLVANAGRSWVDVDHGSAGSMNGLVSHDVTREVVAVSVHG